MPSIEETKRDLITIVSRNIIFPDDQIRILHLIMDGHLICDAGTFSLGMIEDQNLIFPQDVMTLRNLVQTINSGDGNFKCLLELLIAAFQKDAAAGHKHEVIEKDGNKYYKDPVTYTYPDTVDGVKFHVKQRPEYKKIYQRELILGNSELLLNMLCLIASFRSNNSNDYGLRLYFDAESLKVNATATTVKSAPAIPEKTESKDEYDVLMNKADRKIYKCENEYIDQWNDMFEKNGAADIAYNILNVLKDKPYIEIVKIDMKGHEEKFASTLIEEHVKDDTRIINKTIEDIEKKTVVDSFLGFLRNMVGGGDSQTDHRDYTEMKNRYKYEKAKLIHQLLN